MSADSMKRLAETVALTLYQFFQPTEAAMFEAKMVKTHPTMVWNEAWKASTLARSCKKKTSFSMRGTRASDCPAAKPMTILMAR